MNPQTEIYKKQIEEMAKGQISIDPQRTLLLVVDMMNDGNSDEGFFKKVLGADISMFQAIEDNVVRLMRACKAVDIPRVCVQSIYDFAYISDAMRQRFEAMGIQDGQLAPKGAWGSQIIDKLLAEKPEYILIKSHYSALNKNYSFMYNPEAEKNSEFEKYLQLPAEADKIIDDEYTGTLRYYIDIANRARRFRYLADFMSYNVNTVIITGGSTHVCEDATISAISELGYYVIEPIDAVASEDVDKHYAFVHNHGIFKSQLTTTEKIIEAIQKK